MVDLTWNDQPLILPLSLL